MAGVAIATQDGPFLSVGSLNFAASTVVIAGVAGSIIRVYRMCILSATATTTIQFGDGTSTFTGAMLMAAGVPLILPFDGTPWFTTVKGGGFNATLGASTQFSGTIGFTQQPL